MKCRREGRQNTGSLKYFKRSFIKFEEIRIDVLRLFKLSFDYMNKYAQIHLFKKGKALGDLIKNTLSREMLMHYT